jgi:coiled-coil domain-containing protein 55
MERIKNKEDAKNVEADAKRRETLRAEKEKRERRKRKIEEGATSSEEEEEEKTEKSSKGEENKENKPREKKIKPDVWTKITVGEVFEAALQRYFVRKAERTRFP